MATIREKVLPRRFSTPRLIVVGFLVLMALGTVFLIIVSQVRGQERITLFWRTLPRSLVAKALSVVALAVRQRTPHYRYPEEEIAIG